MGRERAIARKRKAEMVGQLKGKWKMGRNFFGTVPKKGRKLGAITEAGKGFLRQGKTRGKERGNGRRGKATK